MKTHIHFVSLLLRSPWGGCEELWSKTALWLREHGKQVSASVKYWPDAMRHPRIGELQRSGAEVTSYGGRTESGRPWLVRGANSVFRKLHIYKKQEDTDYGLREADLVLFSSGGNSFPLGPVRTCQQRGQKYVLLSHSVAESTWPRDNETDALRTVYEGAEAAYFVSQANRASTVYQLGFDSDKFEVVVNPFNVSWETPFSWPEDKGCTEWAFVGRLEPGHKGIDLLLRAFARDHWKNRAVHLNLYGSGFSEQSMRRMATMLDLDARVTFHGEVSGLDQIWQNNALLVLPSRHEGLPLVVTEALLYGRPCLVTNVSGNAEQLEDGVTGFIARGPTVDEVDAALRRAWHDRAKLSAMGKAAYASIRERIPRDPIRVFSTRLCRIADGSPAPCLS